jgi:hypothetical protein
MVVDFTMLERTGQARAAFWEIVAVPDIRAQCHRLTGHICAQLHAA